jgi:hypothetical protein
MWCTKGENLESEDTKIKRKQNESYRNVIGNKSLIYLSDYQETFSHYFLIDILLSTFNYFYYLIEGALNCPCFILC